MCCYSSYLFCLVVHYEMDRSVIGLRRCLHFDVILLLFLYVLLLPLSCCNVSGASSLIALLILMFETTISEIGRLLYQAALLCLNAVCKPSL